MSAVGGGACLEAFEGEGQAGGVEGDVRDLDGPGLAEGALDLARVGEREVVRALGGARGGAVGRLRGGLIGGRRGPVVAFVGCGSVACATGEERRGRDEKRERPGAGGHMLSCSARLGYDVWASAPRASGR